MYHADPAHAGRSLRCRCGRTVPIPSAASAGPDPESAARDPKPRIRIRKSRRSRTGPPAATSQGGTEPGAATAKGPKSGARPNHATEPKPVRESTTTPSPKTTRWRAPASLSRLLPSPARLTRALPILAWSYLAIVVAAVAFMWTWGDAWWPASVLLFGPRWLLLVPVLPLAAVALLVRPRLLLPTALGLIITLGPLMGFRTGWRSWLSTPPPRTLRIITFNTAGDYNPQITGVPIVLAAFQPDVVVLQECPPRLARPEFWPPGWTAHFATGGICLATRFPVLESTVLERVETGNQGGTGNAALFRLLLGGDTIAVAGIHLETPRKGLESLRYGGNSSRMPVNILIRDIGADRVSRWILSEAANPIIAGDFNMPVESRIYREHFGGCTNAFSTIGTGFGWTRVLHRFSARIDHVLACGGWRPLHIEVGPALGSDHRPVIVDLARTREPEGSSP